MILYQILQNTQLKLVAVGVDINNWYLPLKPLPSLVKEGGPAGPGDLSAPQFADSFILRFYANC